MVEEGFEGAEGGDEGCTEDEAYCLGDPEEGDEFVVGEGVEVLHWFDQGADGGVG